MTDLLQLVAPVEIQAAAPTGKRPTAHIVAYGGDVVSVPGFGPLVIDLSGLALSTSLPILVDHNNALDGIVGTGTPRIDGGKQLLVDAILADTPEAGRVVALAKSGFVWSASVGAEPLKTEFVREGDSITANGRRILAGPGGFAFVKKSRLREVSLTPIGCDPGASVSIAASQRSFNMGNENQTNQSNQPANVQIPEELKFAWDKTGLSDAERVEARLSAFRRDHGNVLPDFGNGMIRAAQTGAMTWGDAEREILRGEVRAMKLQQIQAELPPAPAIRAGGPRGLDQQQAFAAGVMIRAGFAVGAERQFGERVLDYADKAARLHLLDLVQACLRADGRDPGGLNRDEMIRASFSTATLPAALGLAGEKILLDAYTQAPASWRTWCKTVSVASFREHTLLRPSFSAGFPQLPPSGEIKHAYVTEETAAIKADTYAKMLHIDRTSIVNDDAGVFGQAAASLGKAAARKLADLAVSTLLGGIGAGFFSEGNSNLLDDPLTLAAVEAAVAILRSRVDADGDNLDITPVTLLVGPALESTARAICESDFIQAAEGAPTGNSMKGVLLPVIEPRLANANITGASATAWAVMAGPVDMPQAVCFLNGAEVPTVEELGMQADVNHLGLAWRAFHDFGSSLIDWRAGVLSTGDGE